MPRNPNRRQHVETRTMEQTQEEPEQEPFFVGPWKMAGVMIVIFACFAVLWPKMFYPMILFALGKSKEDDFAQEKTTRPPFPTPGAHHRPGPGGFPGGGEMPPNMRMPGGGPGPRGVPYQGGSTTSSRGGFSGMLLPMYSIGVICFLLYMLSKIFFKKPRVHKSAYQLKFNSNRDRFEVDGQDSDDSEAENALSSPNKQLNQKQLKSLQNRLTETETALHKILEQLGSFADGIDEGTIQAVKNVTAETLNNLNEYNVDLKTKDSENHTLHEQTYLKDLEKALSDFQRFTENYVSQHQNDHPGADTKSADKATVREITQDFDPMEADDDVDMTPNGEIDEVPQTFDRMESEDLENLRLDKIGNGEIITLEQSTKGFLTDEMHATAELIVKLDKVENASRELAIESESELRHRHVAHFDPQEGTEV